MKNLKVQSTENLSHLNFIKDYLVNKTTQNIDDKNNINLNTVSNIMTKMTNNIQNAQLNNKDINSIIQDEHKERLWMAAGHMGYDQNNLIKSANVY